MRFSALFALFLAAHVVAQTATEPGPDPTPSIEPNPEPAPEPSPDPPTSEPPTTTSEPETSITITDSGTTTEPSGTATTAPPSPTGTTPVGGGSNCVQSCLSEAAAAAGCSSSADFRCVCGSGSYLNTARQCFTRDNCQSSAVQGAEGDYNTSCSSTSQSSRGGPSTRPPATTIPGPTRTQTYTGYLTSLTTQTMVLTSGAVVTLSDGKATTITSAFTTIRTGQVGDFGGAGSGVAPNNNGALGSVNWGPWGAMGMVGLGVVGGLVVLAV